MPSIANLVLADGQASPVNHTFEVMTAQMGEDRPAVFMEKSAGSVNGYLQLTVLTRKSKTNGSYKTLVKLALPTLETVTGSSPSGFAPAPAVAYTEFATLDITHPERSALQNRKDVLAYLASLFNHAEFKKVVHNIEPFY